MKSTYNDSQTMKPKITKLQPKIQPKTRQKTRQKRNTSDHMCEYYVKILNL